MNKKTGILLGAAAVCSVALVTAIGLAARPSFGFGRSTPVAAAVRQNSMEWQGDVCGDAEGEATLGEYLNLRVDHASGTDWNVKVWSEAVALSAGKSYQITFKVNSPVFAASGVVMNINEGAIWDNSLSINEGWGWITYVFAAPTDDVKIELQLGAVAVDNCLFQFESIRIDKVKNLVEGFEAAAWNDSPYNSFVDGPGPFDNVTSASYRVDNSAVEGGPKNIWSNKLQALTNVDLEKDKDYEIHYSVKLDTTAPKVEILHGTRDWEYNYSEKWQGAMDGLYDQAFEAGKARSYTFRKTPEVLTTKVVISIRTGLIESAKVDFTEFRITEVNDYLEEVPVYVCDLINHTAWAEAWEDLRSSNEGKLCEGTATFAGVEELVMKFDNMMPSQRDLIKDVPEGTVLYTYGESVDYFRSRLASNS